MTCIPFSLGNGVGGILCVDPSVGPFLIADGERKWWFEWSDRWGPLRVRQNGASAEQPGPKSSFWTVTCLWHRQGRRCEGKQALYDKPPPITHYWNRVGRSRVIVGSEAEEGYDPDYSEEIYVEVSASADTHPKGGDVEQAPLVSGAVAKCQTPITSPDSSQPSSAKEGE